MFIDDGKGSGRKAAVNDENRLKTQAMTTDKAHNVNHEDGEAYSVVVSKTPTGAGDCFLYIKNAAEKDMILTEMHASAASDEQIQMKLNDSGTPTGGTTNTPVNRNAGSGNLADVTCVDGVDITGLSGGSTVDIFAIDGATGSRNHSWNSDIIVPKNKALTFYATTGAIALVMTASIYFHKSEN